MSPLPNNTVENSPRPQIAIESLPKERSSLPVSPTNNNSSTNLLNNSPINQRNNTNSPSSNGISDHGSSSTSNGVHEMLDTGNFNREIERLKSFEGWRVPFLSAGQMASAGFYYTKKDDIVRCAFCGVEVGSWVEGDNPRVDHQRWSPACRFLRKLPVGNVPLTAADLANYPLTARDLARAGVLSPTSTEGYDTCGSHTRLAAREYGIVLRESAATSPGGRAIEKLGIQQMRPPAYPMFATNESRLASYTSWPISLKLKPNVLSEAGFFYTGKGDQTICYYCGGGLKDWEESDVPWDEHAKWFNRCNYVLSIKGKEFVDKVCNKKPEQDETEVATEVTEAESATESTEPRNESEPSTSATPVLEQSTSAPATVTAAAAAAGGSAASNVESAVTTTADSRLCKICYMEEMGILFLPCGHIVACPKCALLLSTCAVCRKPYSATVRAFLS